MGCSGRCHLKDWRGHCIATLFGEVTVRLPRFRCNTCNRIETNVEWPPRCRSTPELDQLQAHLSALMTYRVAAGKLQHLLPADAGRSPETLRNHTLRIGEQLGTASSDQPTTAAAAASTVGVDSTLIRSREEGERHLEVRVGNVETASRGRQVFGAVAKADTNISTLIRQSLRAVGRTDDTAFTDGCPGLRSILVDAGITTPPILDWFHIAMRIQHATQAAGGLPADNPGRMQAKIVIVDEVERLRWRIWNGKAKNATRSIDRVRKVMHDYKDELGQHTRNAPSRRLWHALLDVDGYLRGQSSWLVNYAKRYRAELRVGTSITEGTANFLVNRRMNKSQQMRWSRRRADLSTIRQMRVPTEDEACNQSDRDVPLKPAPMMAIVGRVWHCHVNFVWAARSQGWSCRGNQAVCRAEVSRCQVLKASDRIARSALAASRCRRGWKWR